MRSCSVAAAFLLMSCATRGLDADPLNLQIEIGRYKALLGQVADYTGVSYDAVTVDQAGDGPVALMHRLEEAAADYIEVRKALCVSRAGATSFVRIRNEACASGFRPAWSRRGVTHEVVARRSGEAGGHIIGLWDAVCAEARRLERDPDVMVCPME